jgi:hypothetical protein
MFCAIPEEMLDVEQGEFIGVSRDVMWSQAAVS